MMLPPKSGRKAVRLRNAGTMSTLSYLYSDIMAAWISSDASQKGSSAELLPRLRQKFLGLAQQIQAVKMQTMVAKWEGSIRGAWPGNEYLKLAGVQADMMSSLALVSAHALAAPRAFSRPRSSSRARSHRSTPRCASRSCTARSSSTRTS